MPKKAEEEVLVDIDQGLLNNDSPPLIPPNQYDPKTTKFYENTKAHNQDKYRTNVLKNAGPFRARVVRVEEQADVNDASRYSVGAVGDARFINVKCYIPLLHSYAIHPSRLATGEDDDEGEHHAIINTMYETFVSERTKDSYEDPAVGEHCWVTYGDLETRSNPVYIDKILDTDFDDSSTEVKPTSAKGAHGKGGARPKRRGGGGGKPDITESDLSGAPSSAEGPFAKIWTSPSHPLVATQAAATIRDPPIGIDYQITAEDVEAMAKALVPGMESSKGQYDDMVDAMWTLANRFARGQRSGTTSWGRGGRLWPTLANLWYNFSTPLMAGQCRGVPAAKKKKWAKKKKAHTQRSICAMSWEELAKKFPKETNLVLSWARGEIKCPQEMRHAINWAAHFVVFDQVENATRSHSCRLHTDRRTKSGHAHAETWEVEKAVRANVTQAYVSDEKSRQWPEPDGDSWVRLIPPEGATPRTVPAKPAKESTRPIIIIGDSGIGKNGDASGNLAEALKTWLKNQYSVKDKDFVILGVTTATAAQWVQAGIKGDSPHRRNSNWPRNVKKFSLAAMAARNPRLVIINLGSNDAFAAGCGRSKDTNKRCSSKKMRDFRSNVIKILNALGGDRGFGGYDAPGLIWMTGPHSPSSYSRGKCKWDNKACGKQNIKYKFLADPSVDLGQLIENEQNGLYISPTQINDPRAAACRRSNKNGCHPSVGEWRILLDSGTYFDDPDGAGTTLIRSELKDVVDRAFAINRDADTSRYTEEERGQ